jgi:hypothetical protein
MHPGDYKDRPNRWQISVWLGFGAIASGVALLLDSTITVRNAPCNPCTGFLGPGPAHYAVYALDPLSAAFILAITALPVAASFDKFFQRWSIFGPALVIAASAFVIPRGQFASNAVVSSEGWVFVGDALLLLGCCLEIVGILWGHSWSQSRVRGPTVPAA